MPGDEFKDQNDSALFKSTSNDNTEEKSEINQNSSSVYSNIDNKDSSHSFQETADTINTDEITLDQGHLHGKTTDKAEPDNSFLGDEEVENITEKRIMLHEIIKAAKEAEEEAERATFAACNANIAAKNIFDENYSEEMISEKIHQARIDITQKASLAAQAALEAQESAREAAAAAIHKAEADAATALKEFREAEKELTRIKLLTEKAEESALDAQDAAELAKRQSEAEDKKAQACKNALKAATILLSNAESKYKEAEENLNQTRKEAIEAEKRLTSAKQQAMNASLEAKSMLVKIEEETQEEEKAEAPKSAQKSKLRTFMRGVWTTFKLVLFAALIALLLRAYVFDITKVIGSSMEPNLNNGDNLFTTKVNYYFEDPERGDIVIIDAPDKNNEYYVKRIIGLPNEEIKIQNGLVYIDGVLLDEEYLDSIGITSGDIHMIIEDGAYFVMGDNRGNSHDSRDDSVGTILKDQIRGKALFRIYPWNNFGSLY